MTRGCLAANILVDLLLVVSWRALCDGEAGLAQHESAWRLGQAGQGVQHLHIAEQITLELAGFVSGSCEI